MKKKLLLSILFVFALSFFALNVNAASITKLSIPNNTQAKAPDTIPSTSDDLYGTVTEPFDFSKVEFAPESGSTNIAGKDDLRKIIIGKRNSNIASASSFTLDTVFSSWFTAYCLDNAKKYPVYGLLSSKEYQDAAAALATNPTDETRMLMIDEIVLAAIGADDNIQTAIRNKGLTNKKVLAIEILEDDGSINRFYDLGKDSDDNDIEPAAVISAVEAMNTNVTINLHKIAFRLSLTDEIVINASDIQGSTGTTYKLTFNGLKILLDKYKATSNGSVTGYDHALWIIEHSYPTLALKTSIEEAGGDYNELRKQICVLEGHTFDDTALTCNGFTALDDYVENYVYATVQYAIWKTTDHAVDGQRLGNKIQNVSQLNTLYRYLINEDRDYDGYSTKTFKNKITVNGPKEKDKPVETSNAYVYGPYKVSYDVLAGGEMTLSVTNADTTGIRIVDAVKNGNEIDTINKGESFYIEVAKKQKISSVTVSIKLNGASVFDPLTNRGRIYNPIYRMEQNVMSGGKIVNKDLETTVELVTNPETGVENVALLLMVTLVAFTLAYLILSYKQKSVSLD